MMVVAMYEWWAGGALATGVGQGTIRGRAHAHMIRADVQPGVRLAWALGREAQTNQTTCKR